MGSTATPNCVLLEGDATVGANLKLESWTDTAAVVGTGGTASLPIVIGTNTCGTSAPQVLGGFSDTCWNAASGTTLLATATGVQIVYKYQSTKAAK